MSQMLLENLFGQGPCVKGELVIDRQARRGHTPAYQLGRLIFLQGGGRSFAETHSHSAALGWEREYSDLRRYIMEIPR